MNNLISDFILFKLVKTIWKIIFKKFFNYS